jgi:hypothetical protein
LQGSELYRCCVQHGTNVSLGKCRKDNPHALCPHRFGFAFVQECVEFVIRLELRTILFE